MKYFLNTKRVLYSESGAFVVDRNGIVQSFEPSEGNPFFDEKTELNGNYIYCTHRSIRTLIVPDGVKGFVSGFMLGVRVTGRFELPEGLINIGNNSFDINFMSGDCPMTYSFHFSKVSPALLSPNMCR